MAVMVALDVFDENGKFHWSNWSSLRWSFSAHLLYLFIEKKITKFQRYCYFLNDVASPALAQRIMRLKKIDQKLDKPIRSICFWQFVVYFDQHLGASHTRKLVKLFFSVVFNLFCSFQPFSVISRLKSTN